MKLGIDRPPAATIHGGLLVDKPSGPTSHDIVGFTRRLLKTSRVGHTGTLDPLATGLLVLLVGHATRLSQFLVSDTKEYIADIRLGIATPTYDAQSLDRGSRVEERESSPLTREQVDSALPQFIGTISQRPPAYSAKKVEGVRAYEMARKSETVDLKTVNVTVYELEPLELDLAPRPSPLGGCGLLRLRVTASAGFYVRSLAHDLGQTLGCGGHLEALRRTRAGVFRVEDAVTLDAMEQMGASAAGRLLPMNALLGEYPEVSLTAEGLRLAGNGNALSPQHLVEMAGVPGPVPGARVRVLGADRELLSVAERRSDGLLHPLLVLR